MTPAEQTRATFQEYREHISCLMTAVQYWDKDLPVTVKDALYRMREVHRLGGELLGLRGEDNGKNHI